RCVPGRAARAGRGPGEARRAAARHRRPHRRRTRAGRAAGRGEQPGAAARREASEDAFQIAAHAVKAQSLQGDLTACVRQAEIRKEEVDAEIAPYGPAQAPAKHTARIKHRPLPLSSNSQQGRSPKQKLNAGLGGTSESVVKAELKGRSTLDGTPCCDAIPRHTA